MDCPSWFVYVLLSADKGRTYVGITTDVARRLRQHNGEIVGGAKYTRAHRPWRVEVQWGPFAGRSEAQVKEAKLKTKRGKERFVANLCADA
jgi:predicted GIY-YIG superfamily endonuclease